MFSFFKSGLQTITKALSKTRDLFKTKIRSILGRPLDEKTLDELEKVLYEADIGSSCTEKFIQHIQKFVKKHPTASTDQMMEEFKILSHEILDAAQKPQTQITSTPHMILIVGVNGSGKTTTCAKLAQLLKNEGFSVLLAAADTFRAAAIDQLDIWAKRLSLDIVKGQTGGDPSSVIFDALTAAKARHIDIVIADTAGRLQSKTDLMHELEKIKRVGAKVLPGAPHETLLVLDATTGQNAVDQALIFNQFTPLTGIILTKLDGSAKGGVALSISETMKLPIRYVGVGEKLEDFMPFDHHEYINALFS